MKRVAITLTVLAFTAAIFAGDDVIRRGDEISKDAKPVALSDVLARPEQYSQAPVVTEGIVEAVCQNKGCWMQLTSETGKAGMRVTFKDYGFFVPKDSKSMTARIEGVVKVKALSKEEADHLAEEGAKITRKEDGTAVETSFVASGVELRAASRQ